MSILCFEGFNATFEGLMNIGAIATYYVGSTYYVGGIILSVQSASLIQFLFWLPLANGISHVDVLYHMCILYHTRMVKSS